MESDNCVSSPIIVLKDCNVLGRGAPSEKPNENRSHSAPNRNTPSLNRGVNTTRISESISSKSLTCFPPRSTSPSPTYVPSAENSPVSGQKPLLSWERPVVTKKISAAKIKPRERSTDIFICQRPPLSRRNAVTALVIFFIITDSEPSRSTPCSDPSSADEIMSPRQTSVEGFPSTVTGHN